MFWWNCFDSCFRWTWAWHKRWRRRKRREVKLQALVGSIFRKQKWPKSWRRICKLSKWGISWIQNGFTRKLIRKCPSKFLNLVSFRFTEGSIPYLVDDTSFTMAKYNFNEIAFNSFNLNLFKVSMHQNLLVNIVRKWASNCSPFCW